MSLDYARVEYVPGGIISNTIVCCRGSESCYQTGISASGNSIICGGYRGCGFYGITIADELVCSGLESCRDAVFISRTIYCLGSRSCSGSTINIQHTGFLDCAGYGSCRNADIQSPGSNAVVTIQITGYVSLSSTNITCRESDICNIFVLAEQRASTTAAIVCLGECNIECPQEFDCPGLAYVFCSFSCTYIHYPRARVQSKLSFLEHRPTFQPRIQLIPPINQALIPLRIQLKIQLLSQLSIPPTFHHQLR